MSGQPFNIAAFLNSGILVDQWDWESSQRRIKKQPMPAPPYIADPAPQVDTTERVDYYRAALGYATTDGDKPPVMVCFKHEDFIEARAVIDELVAASKFMRDNVKEDSIEMWTRIEAALHPFELPPW